MVYWRFCGHGEKKQVCWRDLMWIWRHLCVCPLIDRGQQPMKMPAEVTLLYNVDLDIFYVEKFSCRKVLFRN